MLTRTKLVGNKFQRMRAKLNLFKGTNRNGGETARRATLFLRAPLQVVESLRHGALGGHSSMANVW
ncbi:MAG: hypothetical protein ACTS5P_01965 [Candidatus Hodgkinia cicadicola]